MRLLTPPSLVSIVILLLWAVAADSQQLKETPETLANFDLQDPPAGYEKGIRVADATHEIRVGKLEFKLSDAARRRDGSLEASIGQDDGYEIVSFRLFDHANRKLFHDSAWQSNPDNGPSARKFRITRVGETDLIRIEQTGGQLPPSIDLWLRIVENGAGSPIRIPAEQGASTTHGMSEIVVTSLLAGSMSGRSSPSGQMVWDQEHATNIKWQTTVDLENRGEVLRGQYHLVAVTQDGQRHPMDHKHFLDFSRHGRHNYVLLDVPLDQMSHLELVPFEARHKFFFNGVGG